MEAIHLGNNMDEPMTQNVMAVGSLFSIVAAVLLSVLSGIFAYHRCTCAESMQVRIAIRLERFKRIESI